MIDRKFPWSSSEGNLSRLVASNAVRFDHYPKCLKYNTMMMVISKNKMWHALVQMLCIHV